MPLILVILCIAEGGCDTCDFHMYLLLLFLSLDLNLKLILQKAYANAPPWLGLVNICPCSQHPIPLHSYSEHICIVHFTYTFSLDSKFHEGIKLDAFTDLPVPRIILILVIFANI